MMTHGCSPFTFWLILNNELLVPAALKASSITLSFCFFKHFLGIVIYCSAWNSSSLSLNRQWWHSMHQFASRAWHLRCFHVTHRKSSPKTDMYYLYNLHTSFSYLWCFKDFWALRIDKAQPSFSSGFNPMSEFHRKKIHYQGQVDTVFYIHHLFQFISFLKKFENWQSSTVFWLNNLTRRKTT